ncbi:MAG: molybdate ABC transporter substrate-binding protein [Acidobacteria bacterium RIFCSPLOWO2_02_FULL_67_36]|nr:MAG: molybdate ABC transporter substrate-binding protein [Acidobacteria bacterium RIFCSPLOWO2_02_FULL_67_36]OFW24399.1 MAG: molybdate ABC transporter substrate-binding protein [Acidobacteria bacterium RIFCSPLOWO2_12_FULL_66_21]
MFRVGAFLVTVLVGLVSDTPRGEPPETITVSAAVSLTDALEEVAKAYRAAGNGEVRFNFGPSNMLARQIVNGAPVDLFISADDAQMDVAVASGAMDPATRVNLLSTRLAVVARRGSGRRLRDWRDLEDPSIRRIAVGDPAAVPAGVYAKEFLQRVGAWDRLRPRLVPVSTVRAALAAAANGSADAAVVYETDAAGSQSVEVGFIVSGPQAPTIVYPAAIATHTPNRAAAERFLKYLRGSEARSVFARFKFLIPHPALPAPAPR